MQALMSKVMKVQKFGESAQKREYAKQQQIDFYMFVTETIPACRNLSCTGGCEGSWRRSRGSRGIQYWHGWRKWWREAQGWAVMFSSFYDASGSLMSRRSGSILLLQDMYSGELRLHGQLDWKYLKNIMRSTALLFNDLFINFMSKWTHNLEKIYVEFLNHFFCTWGEIRSDKTLSYPPNTFFLWLVWVQFTHGQLLDQKVQK